MRRRGAHDRPRQFEAPDVFRGCAESVEYLPVGEREWQTRVSALRPVDRAAGELHNVRHYSGSPREIRDITLPE